MITSYLVDFVHIGQTGKSSSSFNFGFKLCWLEADHKIDDNFHILRLENKRTRLFLLDTLEINRLKDSMNLLKHQFDLSSSKLINLFLSVV